MEVSDKLIGVALEAYDSKAGYSKIEKMRAALEAALSTDAEPVKTAPAVAQDDYIRRLEAALLPFANTADLFSLYDDDEKSIGVKMKHLKRARSALSAQVQDVAGWQSVEDVKPDHGSSYLGWVKICETFCAQPIYYSAFSRTWRRKLDGVEVDEVTHIAPLPAAPVAKHGEEE